MPKLLRCLELAGCIVTIDAMGGQRAIARETVDADADHVLALKGNQGTAHAEVMAFLDDAILNTPDIPDFREDDCRARSGFAAENLATFRHLVLNTLRADTSLKASTRAKQLAATWDRT